jgi:hypothetical protein
MAKTTVTDDEIQAIIDSGETGVGQIVDGYDNAFAFYIAAVKTADPIVSVGATTGSSA